METSVGPETKLKFNIKDGKLSLTVMYDGAAVDGSVVVSADAEYFINQFFEIIPGNSQLEQMAKMVVTQAVKNVNL